MKILIKNFGVDSNILKNFYYNERDSDEVEALIQYIKLWEKEDFEDLKEKIVIKIIIYGLDKFCQRGKFN